jgi:hypothetical protein
MSNYFIKLHFRCDEKIDLPDATKVKDEGFNPSGDPPTAKIRKITLDGLVFIKFNSTLKVPSHPEKLENSTVFIGDNDYPALDVTIVPGMQSLSSNLKFNWTFVNFTSSELVI